MDAHELKAMEERGMHEAFRISILLKGLNAGLEVILGSALFFTSQHADFLITLVQNALIDDPNDFLGRHASTILQYLDPHVQLFAALYLMFHGIVKLLLVWGLLRNKLWAYPSAIAVFALFITYQVFKWTRHHSLPLVFLTIFDLVVIVLIYHEYRRRLRLLHIGLSS